MMSEEKLKQIIQEAFEAGCAVGIESEVDPYVSLTAERDEYVEKVMESI